MCVCVWGGMEALCISLQIFYKSVTLQKRSLLFKLEKKKKDGECMELEVRLHSQRLENGS